MESQDDQSARRICHPTRTPPYTPFAPTLPRYSPLSLYFSSILSFCPDGVGKTKKKKKRDHVLAGAAGKRGVGLLFVGRDELQQKRGANTKTGHLFHRHCSVPLYPLVIWPM